MHKRIHYISSFAGQMSDNEIEVLASQAAKKKALFALNVGYSIFGKIRK